jgi:hypothetical protein
MGGEGLDNLIILYIIKNVAEWNIHYTVYSFT